MRVVYIGDFVAPYSTENYVAYALQQHGVEVIPVQEERCASKLEQILEVKPDFVLFSKLHSVRGAGFIERFREAKIPTATWIYDLFFDVPTYFGRRNLRAPSFDADIVFMTDGGHREAWAKHGIKQHLLRQGIHAPQAHQGKKISGVPPIVFIGTRSYEQRIQMLEFLKKTYGKDFAQYGANGERPEVRNRELNDVLASAKIVVGDSMPSENYWSNRIYEITGRAGFLLHPAIPGLEQEFEDGKHYVSFPYGDFATLKKTIDYYLSHDTARETIRFAGHLRTKTRYTYTKRVGELLEVMKKL